MTLKQLKSDRIMDQNLKKYITTNRLCPREVPLLKMGFCPKFKKSCLTHKGNGCEYSRIALVSIKTLSDRSRNALQTYQRKII